MTPPSIYRNFILGRGAPLFEATDTSGTVSQLQTLAQLSQSSMSGQAQRQSEAAAQMLLQGTGPQGQEITNSTRSSETQQVRQALEYYATQARSGDRRSYYDAMRASFVLVHRSLDAADSRAQVPQLLRDFRQLSRDYSDFLAQHAGLGPEERFRYLYAAAGVLRNMLGRIQVDATAREATAGEREELSTVLHEVYTRLLELHRNYLLANPNGEAYTGVLREIQMRQALLENNLPVARQRALELEQSLTAHPPPAEDPNHPETMRWDVRAARGLSQDPDFARLVQGLDAPSAPEATASLLNGVALELLQTVGGTLDQVNEETTATITARYRALVSVASILTMTRPASTLRDLLAALRDPQQSETIRHELESAAEANTELQHLLTEARGHTDLQRWIEQARQAAAHVEQLHQGPGRQLLETIFHENERLNRIHRFATSLSSHPQLLQSLGVAAGRAGDPQELQRLATELFRRGPLAVAAITSYGQGHPDEAVQGLIQELQAESDSNPTINELVHEVLNSYQEDLTHRPDHEVAAAHAVFQLVAQTHQIAQGVELESSVTGQARQLSERVEGYDFRTRRVFSHLSSASSLITLGAGILASELLPVLLLSRAGTSGRLAAPLVGDLVNAGRLTEMGSVVTGLGTGLAMSLIGTGLQTHERSSLGLQTHFGRDFAQSAAINTVTFGATVPFSRWLSNRLAPAAEDAYAVGQLSRGRQLLVHAGSAAFGSTVALGLGASWRRVQTGSWNVSYEEVAENYLSVLAWEMGAAGFRRIRTRVGLSAELEGRPLVEALDVNVRPNASRFDRALLWMQRSGNRVFAEVGNTLFTQLGPHRAALANRIAERMVAGNPQLSPARQFIARQLALQEISAPGSLDQYTDSFFERHQADITGEAGSQRLIFIPAGAQRSASPHYTARLLEAMRRHHTQTAASTDPDYLPRYLPQDPYQVVLLRVDPSTGRIVGVDTHTFGETDGAITIRASYDPVSRLLQLPPLSERSVTGLRMTGTPPEARPQVIELGPMLDAHRSSSVPLLWTEALGRQVVTQRLDQPARARLNQVIGDLNRDHDVTILLNADTGEVLDRLMALDDPSALLDAPENILRMTARYSGEEKTLTLPAPRGDEGEIVLDTESGRIVRRVPEPEGETGSASDRSPSSGGQRPRRGRRDAAATGSSRTGDLTSPSELIDRIVDRRITGPHIAILETPGHDATAPVEVTVYFGRRSGRVLGISEGHQPATGVPEFTIADHLLNNGQIPRNRVAFQGTHDPQQRRITLTIPAEEERPAGTLTLDLRSGELRFEATDPGSGGSEPSGSGTPPASGENEGSPPPNAAEPDTSGANPPSHRLHATEWGAAMWEEINANPVLRERLNSALRGLEFYREHNLHHFTLIIDLENGSFHGVPEGTAHQFNHSQIHFKLSYDAETQAYRLPPFGEEGPVLLVNPATGEQRTLDPDADTTAPRPVVIRPTADPLAPLAPEVLRPGDARMVTGENSLDRLREGQDHALIPGIGMVSAYTEVGISKILPARNEDAYGFALSPDGSLVAVAADGAGGSGAGDLASSQAIERILSGVRSGEPDLGQLFLDAHQAVTDAGHGGYTVATGIRLRPDGQVDVALVGDSQLWIARRRSDGSYAVLAPYLPNSPVGRARAMGAIHSTQAMHASPIASRITSRLGGNPGDSSPTLYTQTSGFGVPPENTIYSAPMTVPSTRDPNQRVPFRAQAGDVFILMSDGIAELFTRSQMAEAIRGQTDADGVRRAIQTETNALLDLYRNRATQVPDGQRAEILEGNFHGNFINNSGDIFDHPSDGNLVGHVGPDNVVALVVRYDPSTGDAPSSQPEDQ